MLLDEKKDYNKLVCLSAFEYCIEGSEKLYQKSSEIHRVLKERRKKKFRYKSGSFADLFFEIFLIILIFDDAVLGAVE